MILNISIYFCHKAQKSIYDMAPTILIRFVSEISHGVFYDFRYNPFSTKTAPSECRCFDIETCKNTNFCKYARSL